MASYPAGRSPFIKKSEFGNILLSHLKTAEEYGAYFKELPTLGTNWKEAVVVCSEEVIKSKDFSGLRELLLILRQRFTTKEFFDLLRTHRFVSVLEENPMGFFNAMEMKDEEIKTFLSDFFDPRIVSEDRIKLLDFYVSHKIKVLEITEAILAKDSAGLVLWYVNNLQYFPGAYKNPYVAIFIRKFMASTREQDLRGRTTEKPTVLSLSEIPWVKEAFPESKSIYHKNVVFLNLNSNYLFKQVLEKDDVAPLFGITNRALKRVLYKNYETKVLWGRTEYKILDFKAFVFFKDLLEVLPKNVDQQLLLPLAEKYTLSGVRGSERTFETGTPRGSRRTWDEPELRSEISLELRMVQEVVQLFSYLKRLNEGDPRYPDFQGEENGTIVSKIYLVEPLSFLKSLSVDLSFLHDTVYMLSRFMSGNLNYRLYSYNHHPDSFLRKAIRKRNINTIRKLHDYLQKVVKGEIDLEIGQEDLKWIHGKKVRGLTVHVPSSSKELEECGSFLSICVGNGSYARKILMKESNILFLKDGKDVKYCVEIKGTKIIQCKGRRNSLPPVGIRQSLSWTLKTKGEGSFFGKLWFMFFSPKEKTMENYWG